MQVHQLFVLRGQFVGGHVDEGAVEVVDAVEEVFGEAGKGEVARGGDFAFRLFLQVAVVGDCSF